MSSDNLNKLVFDDRFVEKYGHLSVEEFITEHFSQQVVYIFIVSVLFQDIF